MTRFGTILVATDGSDDSDAAVEAALDLAHDTNGRLLVLSVVPVGASDDDRPDGDDAAESTRDDQEVVAATDRANDVVDHAVEWGLEATPLVWEGEPADAILAAAISESADVIVIGSSGRTGVGRMLLGSVTDDVVRRADVPVMVVRAPRDRDD
ncbi:MAG: universal stress protein [Chloroflexi bacterium]|nr:universal stress protein [Chloroflexota bacterium]